MPYHPVRPVSKTASWSRRFGIFAFTLAITAFLFHRAEILTEANAIAVILLAAVLSLIAVIWSMIGFGMLWLNGAKGGKAAFLGLLLAALVLAPVGYAASRLVLLPPIRDVTTDLAAPPAWLVEPLADRSWLPSPVLHPTEQRALQTQFYGRLSGRRYDGAIDRVLEAVTAMAEDRQWQLIETSGAKFLAPGQEPPPEDASAISADEGPADEGLSPDAAPEPEEARGGEALSPLAPGAAGAAGPGPLTDPVLEDGVPRISQPVVRLQFVWRSPLLGVTHDILIRLEEEAETTFVDMRAATRIGRHDLGLNARLIQDFLGQLDVALLGIAGSR
ncbi:DUF1499 domain-containing protein [Pseudohoeflea coraliihabitans]|uniref:DUF1499 domain-containing protein n=1 Tax=Pseudohoeflea coraliihabitans TaxID=2860393 RepID=A0ABS6WM95_9HYPH|nr:DUF1499 domain-containing protein [Pseudohoeflea sp. DP4N28-3]MBW3096905.1 DUF1499 domain-containing protein [Pseudohoeflea sp. DP4N28-3]